MEKEIKEAFILGVERIAAWSKLLDDINVFPVADGDTGRNLRISLAPLREMGTGPEDTARKLLISARGNSGNIAAGFFSGFITADSIEGLSQGASLGRERAWRAVNDPVPGTMLTVFDELVEILREDNFEFNSSYVSEMISRLEGAVRSTPELLPRLKDAGVVDSGALGMYIFFEGFFKSLTGEADDFQPVTAIFKDMLNVSSSFAETMEEGYCVDMVVNLDDGSDEKIERVSEYGQSILVVPHEGFLKVHLHTANREEVRKRIESLGEIVEWSDDDLGLQITHFRQKERKGCVHIITDAAGSLTRKDSDRMGITLLDSYIVAGERSLPETLFPAVELYKFMREGIKVSTSQASVFERHQHYQSVLNRHERILYLCVGSVYTGNYEVVMKWKQEHDTDNRMTVIDTGAASGRLGTIAILTSRYSSGTDDPESVIEFAKRAVDKCQEYVFLDRLQYLAAGGRLSKTSAFFGDMLHMKPVVSPTAEGAKKVGVVRNQNEQLKFALKRLDASIERDSGAFIMLEYSDNKSWVEETIMREVARRYPSAEIKLQPLSLTSGVHMGPGTWAVAFLPDFSS